MSLDTINFSTGTVSNDLNSTISSSALKVASPVGMKEYRPIACCNVLYKVYSEVLTETLNGVVDGLISEG